MDRSRLTVNPRSIRGRPPAHDAPGAPVFNTKGEAMATEIYVWTGADWESCRGPQGATGPEGPTVVSADAVNVAKIGTDGKILVAQADLDARYVNVIGDNMTGVLSIKPAVGPAAPDGTIAVIGDNTNAIVSIQRNSDANTNPAVRFKRSRGTTAAQTAVQANDGMGVVGWHGVRADGSYALAASLGVTCIGSPIAGDAAIRSEMRFVVGNSNGAGTTQVMAISTEAFFVSCVNFAVNAAGFITSKDGILVQRTRLGAAGQFETSNVGSGETGYGVQAKCTGASLTSGGVTGVRGEVTGTVSTGTAVAAVVTATATQNYGLVATISGGTRNCGVYVDVQKAANSWSVQCQGDADSYFKGNVGISWSTPTNALEIGGAAMIRSTLNVVGNITSAGTAHSFAAGSIPSSAVVGGTAFTPATSAAAGAVGSMRWDENFLYIRTATAWKRVALATF